MFFKQLLDPDLGCASYVLGCDGRAVVVDPGIDTGRYLSFLEESGAALETIVETHTHADHVSGREALAAATGARIRLPWIDGRDGLADSDTIEVGLVRLQVIATPGHRPEHIALSVTDTARDQRPWLLLSGDSLLVGDLARPDLAVDPREGAHALQETVGRLYALGDCVELWPGHVGGSLCGGPGLSPKTSSTIGYERLANPLARCSDRDEFASRLLEGIPPRPPTVERVVARNATLSPTPAPIASLNSEELALQLGRSETILIDGRDAELFELAHLPGSVNLPLSGTGLGTRAGWVIDPDAPVVVCAEGEGDCAELARRLRAVAIDGVLGTAPGGVDALRAAGCELRAEAAITVAELAERIDDFTLVDVRDKSEWDAGHAPGSIHLPLHHLHGAAESLPHGRPLAVVCASGKRSAFAASWLRREGFLARRLVGGGVADLADHGIDLVGE